jgi:hypothetical protein
MPTGRFTLDCDKLLPSGVRAQVAPKGKLTFDSVAVDQMNCKFDLPNYKSANVSYTCTTMQPDFLEQMKTQFAKRKTNVEEVSIGKGALYTSMLGSHSFSLIDPETGCLVMFMTTAGDRKAAEEKTRAIEAALTLESAR